MMHAFAFCGSEQERGSDGFYVPEKPTILSNGKIGLYFKFLE